MNVPLELTFRGVHRTDSIAALIREKAAGLERFCDHISSCRIVVEKPQSHQNRGVGYRVRVDLTVPPGHELVAHRGPTEGNLHEELRQLIRETFAAAERQLKELVERQRREVKRHPEQEVPAAAEGERGPRP
jgi:ribosome-associated translation inhibitor RaiA